MKIKIDFTYQNHILFKFYKPRFFFKKMIEIMPKILQIGLHKSKRFFENKQSLQTKKNIKREMNGHKSFQQVSRNILLNEKFQ